MIKILKGSATELELRAIAKALQVRKAARENHNQFGKPTLRAPLEIADKDQS